jgi:hypothetical protein
MTTVTEAIAIVRRALPNASFGLRALVVAIGGLESHWGDGWSVTNQWSSGIAGTNNWGAITADPSWTGETFEHVDHRPTPSGGVEEYTAKFRKYPTPDAGAKDLGNLLQHRYSSAVSAAESGRWHDVSSYLYDGGYYSGFGGKKAAVNAHYSQLSKFLKAQGIDPAILAGAAALEWALWAFVGIIVVRKAKHR